MRGVSKKQVFKACYFLCCCVFVLGLSAIRSGPVYGKLPFILLDSRPWWTPWQAMISTVLEQGEQPVLTDMITSAVLRGVFDVETVSRRYDRRFGRIDVDRFLASNPQLRKILPAGSLLLLLDDSRPVDKAEREQSGVHVPPVREVMLDAVKDGADKAAAEEKVFPYRCLINLHGFSSSWVGAETGHWSVKWAEPSLIYEYKGKRGKDIGQLLRENPPANCTVYF